MLLQGGLTVRHRAHNPKIGGSIPLPARKVVSNESIYQQHTAGVFGRPLSSCDRYFLNFPLFFNSRLASGVKSAFAGFFYCGKFVGNR